MKKRLLRYFQALTTWPCHKPGGFSMPIVLMSVGVVGLVAAGLTSLWSNRMLEARINQIGQRRTMLMQRVRELAAVPTTLFTSMAHNIELDRCVRGGGCAANKKFAFHAYAPIAQNGAAVHISGVPGREVRYDMNGLICSGPTSQCPHLLRTYFIAKCPNDTANCNQAAFLQVRAEIAQDNSLDLAPNLKGYRAPVLPKDPNLFESKTFVTEIIASVQQECGFGSFMTGVDEKGYITCKCDTGYTQVGFDQLTGKPNCLADKIYCPANTFFNGMKNGKQVCLPIQILYSCSWINVADGSPMNCGNGGKSRLRAVSGQDQCFVEVNQAAREGYVRCPNIRAYCCTQVFQ